MHICAYSSSDAAGHDSIPEIEIETILGEDSGWRAGYWARLTASALLATAIRERRRRLGTGKQTLECRQREACSQILAVIF